MVESTSSYGRRVAICADSRQNGNTEGGSVGGSANRVGKYEMGIGRYILLPPTCVRYIFAPGNTQRRTARSLAGDVRGGVYMASAYDRGEAGGFWTFGKFGAT